MTDDAGGDAPTVHIKAGEARAVGRAAGTPVVVIAPVAEAVARAVGLEDFAITPGATDWIGSAVPSVTEDVARYDWTDPEERRVIVENIDRLVGELLRRTGQAGGLVVLYKALESVVGPATATMIVLSVLVAIADAASRRSD